MTKPSLPWDCRASSPSSSPEHLVQVAFQEGDRVQGKLLQAGQVEKLRGELHNQLLLLLWGDGSRHLDVREK
jgi:hypothetical protein